MPKNQSENPTSEDTSNSKGSNKTETSNSQNNDDTNTNQSSKKESNVENAKKKVEGGTLEPILYSQSPADSTKNRCYELVNKYINQ